MSPCVAQASQMARMFGGAPSKTRIGHAAHVDLGHGEGGAGGGHLVPGGTEVLDHGRRLSVN